MNCEYCKKDLSEYKGETSYGCLDCYDTPWMHKIDQLKKENEKLRACVDNKSSLFPRFWSKVDVLKKNQCWNWRSSISPNGYGKLSVNNKPCSAHVLSYKFFNDDFNEEMVIDHICMNRKCVNPSHLRQVTRRTNNIENSSSVSALNNSKTHCSRGHEYNGENTYYRDNGWRDCRKCWSIRRLTLKELTTNKESE